MKVLRYIFSLFIASMFALMIFSSCNNFEGSQEIPAYIHVDTFLLTTNYEIEGAASHKITDVWLYIDNNLQGCYEMPATIPVLERGKHKITIYPGIKLNGISSTRTINPFYKPYIIEELELEEKVIDTIHPSTTYYSKDESTLEFAFKDDFERQIFVEDSNGNGTENVDNSVENSTLEFMGGTLGKGVVLLSDKQRESLLEELGFDAFNHYISRLADFIIKNNASVGNHYATIRKWAKEDSKI
jgi:hypothetical protein